MGTRSPKGTTMQFAIHQTKLESLSKLIEKLAKTATKLKAEAPEAIVRGVQIWPAITTASGYLVKPQQTKTIVEFLGVSPKLEGGWEFLATLEHLGDTNVVRAIPGVTLPEAFQTSKPFCDHCQKIRGRKETFVVKSEAGEIKQVGRACLKDYLGHKSLEQIGWLHTLIAEIREFNDDEGSSHIPNQIGPIEMLIHAVAVIEAFGFFGREAAARCDQFPTSDRVLANIWGLNETDKVQLTEAHLAKAEEVFAWIGTLSSDSQYNHNLKATALHK
ncbi:MAG: hypothetical protein EB119_09275, partial [Synechococcaceae bacterium WBB_34_004]|nr:hypothetical protein [Synechococcaceae bacterium WBB_34_004]